MNTNEQRQSKANKRKEKEEKDGKGKRKKTNKKNQVRRNEDFPRDGRQRFCINCVQCARIMQGLKRPFENP